MDGTVPEPGREMPGVTTEPPWLATAKRLQALAATGLAYTEGPYDRERYTEIHAIASQMLATLFSAPIEQIGALAPDATAYPNPKIDVRGAVVEADRILLVREGETGHWTLPGGFAEIGLSAAENVVKEVTEEALIDVVVDRLYAVRHKAKGPFQPDPRDFYKFYFLCSRTSEREPAAGPEVTDVGWFTLDALPELCTDRIVAEDLERAFAYRREPMRLPLID